MHSGNASVTRTSRLEPNRRKVGGAPARRVEEDGGPRAGRLSHLLAEGPSLAEGRPTMTSVRSGFSRHDRAPARGTDGGSGAHCECEQDRVAVVGYGRRSRTQSSPAWSGGCPQRRGGTALIRWTIRSSRSAAVNVRPAMSAASRPLTDPRPVGFSCSPPLRRLRPRSRLQPHRGLTQSNRDKSDAVGRRSKHPKGWFFSAAAGGSIGFGRDAAPAGWDSSQPGCA